MASIKELQTRLDNKTFNPAELNDAQRDAVDMALQQGVLKGYSSVSEIEKERRIGEKLVAKEKTEKAQPFTTATKGMIPFASEDRGIKRSDLELIGDVAVVNG